MESCPLGGSDVCDNWDACALRPGLDDLCLAELESKPVPDVRAGGVPEVYLRFLARDVPVDVDVKAAADTDVACEQRGRALDDPVLVREVEALEKTVVRELTLKLRQRPSARPSQILKPRGERGAERCR